MTIAITHYGTTYSTTFPDDDTTFDEVVRAWVNLMIAAGYSQKEIVALFKDGDPNHWYSAWEPIEPEQKENT
jgi:hypothetical protein